jgi:hypothetical protein
MMNEGSVYDVSDTENVVNGVDDAAIVIVGEQHFLQDW